MAAYQQHKVDDQPLATLPFWDFSFRVIVTLHFKKITFSYHQAFPRNVGTSLWWQDVLPDVNQLGLGKRRWNLVTSSVEVEFHLRTIFENGEAWLE